ncbi:MAG: MopE-related protein [bacterium]|nr:hypothetical protein [bacterium]MBU1917433.1 hypothetical protein [bacterium]
MFFFLSGCSPVQEPYEEPIDTEPEDTCDQLDQDTYYRDFDGDGYGDSNDSLDACEQPAGYVTNNDDCDDSDSSVNPDAYEIYGDSIDNDCDDALDRECHYTTVNCGESTDVSSFAEAQDRTRDNGLVQICSGTYHEQLGIIRPLTIEGVGDVTIAGWGEDSEQNYSYADAMISGITFTDYDIAFKVMPYATVTMTECNFSENVHALWVTEDGELILEDSLLTNNDSSTSYHGSAMRMETYSTAEFHNVEVSQNLTATGGTIYLNIGATLYMYDSSIHDNVNTDPNIRYGMAIDGLGNTSIYLYNTDVYNHPDNTLGGAIQLFPSTGDAFIRADDSCAMYDNGDGNDIGLGSHAYSFNYTGNLTQCYGYQETNDGECIEY